MNYNSILVIIFLIAILLIILRVFIEPLKMLIKLIFSCVVGGIGIIAFNAFGGIIGLHIGLNILTIFSVALLGLPGLALLLLLQIVFKI